MLSNNKDQKNKVTLDSLKIPCSPYNTIIPPTAPKGTTVFGFSPFSSPLNIQLSDYQINNWYDNLSFEDKKKWIIEFISKLNQGNLSDEM